MQKNSTARYDYPLSADNSRLTTVSRVSEKFLPRKVNFTLSWVRGNFRFNLRNLPVAVVYLSTIII